MHENNFVGWFETSAKDNTNIDESARALVAQVGGIDGRDGELIELTYNIQLPLVDSKQ